MKKIEIIIVDDHLLFSQALNGLVSNYDEFNVIKVLNNGKELIDYFSVDNLHPDIVLMDIKMPIMDGFEALNRIKKNKPEMIIIAQSAYSSSDEIHKTLAIGFDDFISKPISVENFKSLIKKYLHTLDEE